MIIAAKDNLTGGSFPPRLLLTVRPRFLFLPPFSFLFLIHPPLSSRHAATCRDVKQVRTENVAMEKIARSRVGSAGIPVIVLISIMLHSILSVLISRISKRIDYSQFLLIHFIIRFRRENELIYRFITKIN